MNKLTRWIDKIQNHVYIGTDYISHSGWLALPSEDFGELIQHNKNQFSDY